MLIERPHPVFIGYTLLIMETVIEWSTNYVVLNVPILLCMCVHVCVCLRVHVYLRTLMYVHMCVRLRV